MTAFLRNLRRRGIDLDTNAGRLVLTPAERVTPHIRKVAAENQAAILEELVAELERDVTGAYAHRSTQDLEDALTRLYRGLTATVDTSLPECPRCKRSRLFWLKAEGHLVPQLYCYHCAPPPDYVVAPTVVRGELRDMPVNRAERTIR